MNFFRDVNIVAVGIIAFFLLALIWVWYCIISTFYPIQSVSNNTSTISYPKSVSMPIITPITTTSVDHLQIIPTSTPQIVTSTPKKIIKKEPLVEKTSTSSLGIEKTPVLVSLDVPFVSQAPEKKWVQPWEDACEEATILMLDAYYKKYDVGVPLAKEEILKLVNWEEEQGWGGSIELEKIQILFTEFFGLKTIIIENPTVAQIKSYLDQGTPVLLPADGRELENPHFVNGGPPSHTIIIRGYTSGEFITNDPGTQYGKNFRYSIDNLMQSMHDWNGGDVKNGKTVILVVESGGN